MAKKKTFVLKAKHKSKKGGLTAEGRRAYNRATGSHLKAPQPEGGSRKKSYCARSKGQMKDHNIDCSKTPDKRICLARRRWKCNKSLQKSDMPPKAKLAAFLRDHIDNKLALKAAEPTITKSGKLEKGARGDWKKEGYKIKYKALPNNEHEITAHTKTGEIVGSAYLLEHSPYEITAADVSVDEDHRRKGLASAMYELAEKKTGKKMVSASEVASQQRGWNEEEIFSSDAEKLWSQPKRKFGKSQNANKTGMSALMKALKQCACKKSDKLPGGKGDTKDISDFDAKEVEMGLKVEMEHTKDREVAQEIVADHLTEDPSYYSKLKGSGLADELKKAISPEQQKENIRKQRELQNRQVVSELKGFAPASKEYDIRWSGPRDYYGVSPGDDYDDDFENFLEDNQYSLPNEFHIVQGSDIVGSMIFGPHKNGKNIHIIESDIKKEHQNKGGEELAQKMAEKHFGKPLLTSKKTQPKSVPSKPESTPAPASSKASHLRVVKSLEKAGRCWEGYEPTPGKKPYSKGSCRKIKKLQKNDNEEYDFNSLEELKNHLNEHYPLKIDDVLLSNYTTELDNHYFDPYFDDVVKYRDYYTVHPSINNDEFEETYLNHFGTLDQMHRQAAKKLKEDWENQEHKEWNEYKDKYENWANNILKTIHNHCGKDNYSVNEAKTTNSKYIWGTKGEDGPEFLIRLSDHPPKDEFDNEFNDKSKKTLSLLFPENTFMRSKNHQEWNKDFNRAQQKGLSFSSKHKIGDHEDVHDFLSDLNKPMQKSIKQKLIKAFYVQKLKKSISAEAIEAGQYQGEKLDSHHHNRLGNEYKGMAQKAHKMGDRKKAREFHDKALHHFKMADKLGFQEEEPLEKKISGKIAAGLTALAGMMPTQQTTTIADKPPQIEAPKPIIPKEKYPDLGSAENITSLFQLNTGKPLHMFLWNIAQLESTGGENTDHAIITDPESPHYGTKAIGNFALMPNTVKEFVNRYRLNGGKDPRILKIAKMNARSGEINKYIEQNPDIEFKVAGNAAKHVIEKHGYSPEAAYAWKYGHNKTPESIKSPEQQAKMKTDKYVSDFKQLMEGGSPKQLTPAIKISKPDVK